MTEEEKNDNPSHKITGGFLRNSGRTDYSRMTEGDKKLILSLPGYDDAIFKEITGISLQEPEISVIINGVEKKIKKSDAEKLGLL